MALPTRGRVVISTTVGEIDIELWSKETPKTCRNFLALAMEGYYDGVIFHRVVPGFLVQTGDKTGTGGGGESFYGEPFEDEIHPRLRLPHRGIVAMANNGTKNSNDSQFFITLDRADELHGKHTVFGRCVGDTIYNVLKIGEMELDANERPVYPPKIKFIRILDNPFDDIIPRITAAERREQERARQQAQREREEMARRRGAKKDIKLLSFGEEEAEDETVKVKKTIVRPDLLEVSQQVIPDFINALPVSDVKPASKTKEIKEKKPDKLPAKTDEDLTKIRERHAEERASSSNLRKTEIEKMEADIRRLSRRRDGNDSDDEASTKKKKQKSYLAEEMAKYSRGRGPHKKKDGKRKDDGDVLAALNSFRSKLQKSSLAVNQGPTDEDEGEKPQGEEDPGIEMDNDREFLSHALHFAEDDGEESRKAERDYEVIDPRQRGARAKEEERERKRQLKGKGGGGRYHRR